MWRRVGIPAVHRLCLGCAPCRHSKSPPCTLLFVFCPRFLCSGELCYLPMSFLSTQRPGVPIGHIYGWPLRVCLVGTWNFQLQHILFGEFYAIDCHLNLLNIISSISLFFMRGGGSSQGLLLGTPCARCAMEPPLLRGESQNEK